MDVFPNSAVIADGSFPSVNFLDIVSAGEEP